MELNSRALNSSAGAWLLDRLVDTKWTTFRAAAAFLKQSGLKYIAQDLHTFAQRGGTTTRVAVGISSQGTSLEGLQDLWRLLDGYGQLTVVHEGTGGVGSFHPKGYLFTDGSTAELLVGSSNLTQGGLYSNHELSLAVTLDLGKPNDQLVMAQFETALDAWQTPGANCLVVDPTLLQTLHDRGDLPSEDVLRVAAAAARAAKRPPSGTKLQSALPPSPFGASARTFPPPPKAYPTGLPAAVVSPGPAPSVPTAGPGGGTSHTPMPTPIPAPKATPPGVVPGQFFIEVVPHHNGEFFLSMRAIRQNPAFFNYPFAGWTTPKRANNPPYPQLVPDPVVEIMVYDPQGKALKHKAMHPLNVVEYTRKSEIRLTLPDRLQDHIPPMSVLVMTKDPSPAHDYRLDFYPPGAAPATVIAKLTTRLPSGGAPVARRYGW